MLIDKIVGIVCILWGVGFFSTYAAWVIVTVCFLYTVLTQPLLPSDHVIRSIIPDAKYANPFVLVCIILGIVCVSIFILKVKIGQAQKRKAKTAKKAD